MQEELILTDTHKRAMRKKLNGTFVKGPIPRKWIEKACKLGGQEARLAWEIWYRHGLNRGKGFLISNIIVKSVGLNRQAKGKALDRLAAAGLITVTHKPGCAPFVEVEHGNIHSTVSP